MIWWASQPSRARSERLAIAELEEQNDWLHRVTWRLTQEARLCADFAIDHLGSSVELTLTYPSFFPDMPPQITPRGNERLSGHQYGPGGELCLEYRPDNWEPSFTGAMLIESARRLLEGEEPAPGQAGQVENAHRTTVAQDIRSAAFRFVISEGARRALVSAPLLDAVEAEIVEHFVAGHWLAFPRKVFDAHAVYWDAVSELPNWNARKGYFVRLSAGLLGRVTPTYTFLQTLVTAIGRDDVSARFESAEAELIFIIECDGDFKLISLVAGTGERSVFDYRTIAPTEEVERLPPEYARLAEAAVAIVGCGSVGSKIAASLARAGVDQFVLVDGDLLHRGNLVRNDLDWRSVGLNKPDAVAARIREIRPSARVTSRRIDLGGQESSASSDSALVAVGKCHVVVDATADPQVFNLCGAVARNERRTLVWGEVFGGGIGGLVARIRPDVDPVPHAARRQISDWCADRGKKPPEASGVQYGLALTDDAKPLVADDADVTLIAAHMTRLILDALLHERSLFPQSAYAVGLKPGWIFDYPFDTWPISLVSEGEWGPQKDDNLAEQLEAFASEFFPDADGGTPE